MKQSIMFSFICLMKYGSWKKRRSSQKNTKISVTMTCISSKQLGWGKEVRCLWLQKNWILPQDHLRHRWTVLWIRNMQSESGVSRIGVSFISVWPKRESGHFITIRNSTGRWQRQWSIVSGKRNCRCF
jgi:transcriptional regulator, MarR family